MKNIGAILLLICLLLLSACGSETEQDFGEDGSPVSNALGSSDSIYVENAGVVLAGAYLPHLLIGLNHIKDGKFVDEGHQAQCPHYIQYLVTGRTKIDKSSLPLANILCGLDPSTPASDATELLEEQRTYLDLLLRALRKNWLPLSSSSVDTIRINYFQRPGRLTKVSGGWNLTVQRKTIDVLLDQVPWSYSVVSHSWMKKPLYVTW